MANTLQALRKDSLAILRQRGLASALGSLQTEREMARKNGLITRAISEAEMNDWLAEVDQVEAEVREAATATKFNRSGGRT